MSGIYESIQDDLRRTPKKWLITGVAGFIGSNLLEALLQLDQAVIGLDNFATGHQRNLREVEGLVSAEQWRNFTMLEADIRQFSDCSRACEGVDYVLHQAALGSVPRSIADPLTTNACNITGFLHMITAARDAGVKSFVYAASSSTYGDHPGLPKVEDVIGQPLSPYAVTKYVNELYATVFGRLYDFKATGLRYFNVFGRRQDPEGPYAAVIPKWFAGLLRGDGVYINGDGQTSRDFCYIDNVVQINLLAACTANEAARGEVFNVACGGRTSLNELFFMIRDRLAASNPACAKVVPKYLAFRPGDVLHSLADISKAGKLLGYQPLYTVGQGLDAAQSWYVENL